MNLLRVVFTDSRFRYLLVGGSSALLEYLVFIALNESLKWLIFANVMSFLVGLVVSFILHRQWSFGGEHVLSGRKQLMSYAGLAAINSVLSSVLIYSAVELIGLLPWVGKLVTMALIVCWNYVILNKLIFKKSIE